MNEQTSVALESTPNASNAVFSYTPNPNLYDFHPFDGTNSPRQAPIPTFSTTNSFDLAYRIANIVSLKRRSAPRDFYNIISVFLAVDPTNNTPIPILRAEIYSGFAGWVTERITNPFISPESGKQDPRWSLNAHIRRVDRNIAFNIFVFLLNWIFAVSMVLLAAYCFLVENELPDSIVVLPMTALFSMPALRSALPDFPAGDEIDERGFTLCMIMVAIATAMMLLNLTIRTMSKDGQEWIVALSKQFQSLARRVLRPAQHRANQYHHDEANANEKANGTMAHRTGSNEAVTLEIH